MTTLVQTLFNGLALGSVYALISLGFTLVHKASDAVNFAHGSLLLLGGYLVAVLHTSLGFPGALVVAAAATALAAVTVGQLLRAARAQGAAVPTILTIGVDILLFTELARRIGTDVLNLGDPWGARVASFAGVTVAQARVASLVAAVLLVAAFLAAFRWTRWGLAMRVNASDREAAALMGARGERLRASAWALAGLLAAVAAVFLTAFPTPGLDRTTGQVALKAFPAAVVGGLGSVGGALVGSLLVGLAEAFSAGYQDQLSPLGSGLSDVAPYLVMVLVLIARPQGLLGAKESSRV
ncbi:branched-chain amino acid ABC transporter permease [Streptacidiphilus jiangxiensis]|uniref:Branched-chain amino acid transport system permease protein n=1 Tax=Streptacidiphilus jiangxiensis TaxID=235985 RepID=A0A1H7T605_STRJI|nr:branched-chain amino acid ABC transporter permease [Streptacidiphilus jiangxiensis]SEL79686.1 branched-chain amino acid transport system permease protein [Streptacidiphilus jiangxiensis]